MSSDNTICVQSILPKLSQCYDVAIVSVGNLPKEQFFGVLFESVVGTEVRKSLKCSARL